LKWDRTGIVIERLPHRQYWVKVDGSGRPSLRNRVHLRPLLHVRPHTPILPKTGGVATPAPLDVTNTPTTTSTDTSASAPETTPQAGTGSTSQTDDVWSVPSEGSSSSAPAEHDGGRDYVQPRRTRREPDKYGEWVKH
jgi:hypothetical protein